MSDEWAIKIEHLSKVYKIFDKPMDRVKEAFNPFHKRYSSDFYALNDVSLTLKKGETVGIIGKNGAGKSTILKIITGVLTPTSGNVQVNGRIASLLELGAGFNPEMTGVENIYLNGTIMGYRAEEMDARLQDIVDFADIGDFIHQPVKMYSSGMFARLAFAMNIAVEPDILIVDEALSVGDFMFQFKCMQKFKELQQKGITILFVSHSSQQIINVCDRCIFLKNGHVKLDSYDVQGAVFSYEEDVRDIGKTTASETAPERLCDNSCTEENNDDDDNDDVFNVFPDQSINEYRYGNHEAVVDHICINYDDSDNDEGILESGRVVFIKLYIKSKRDMHSIAGGCAIQDVNGSTVWGTNTLNPANEMKLRKGWNVLTYKTELNIVPGNYLMMIGLANTETGKRIELDQRKPARLVQIISYSVDSFEGPVFANMKVYMR